ncbi:MAG: hypothetical protein IAF02_19380 [Anaerolineae bacterium]|nr:hypothetical protein [Anaerolineae bacterium]
MPKQEFIPEKKFIRNFLIKLSLFLMTTHLVACSVQTQADIETDSPIQLPMSETSPPTTTHISTATLEPQTAITLTLEPTITTTSTATSPPIPSPTESTVSQAECPSLVNNLARHIWSSGGILFNTGKLPEGALWWPQVEKDGIWVISANSLEPQLAYQPAKYVSISPDGNRLVSGKAVSTGNSPIIVLYSINTGKFNEIVLPLVVGEPIVDQYPTWISNDHVANITRLEKNLGSGEIWNEVVVDATSQKIESSTLELNLPEYYFDKYDEEQGIPTGFVAVDPTRKRVLYTAGNDQNHEIRLLDLETGEILWKERSEYLTNNIPQWSQDGQRVLFNISMLRQDVEPYTGLSGDSYIPFAWSKLVSLSRDGEEEALPLQPYPGLLDQELNNFSRSPDSRYIFYSFYSYETSSIHAYIVDTLTGENRQICDPQSRFFGSWPLGSADSGKVEVHWLPNSQLVYRTLVEKDGQWAHSLRVLTIPEWTSEVIYEADPRYGINVFGWTPVEFPKP